jgi:hypothetical protein
VRKHSGVLKMRGLSENRGAADQFAPAAHQPAARLCFAGTEYALVADRRAVKRGTGFTFGDCMLIG